MGKLVSEWIPQMVHGVTGKHYFKHSSFTITQF
nr:MAG TPA: hypothetical protein [Herelleviridae sp.]DAO46523.1 MAG TPA: hypothetical protein [Caudoviricetes sp.]DAQ36814.1 MAG TPA: hypothetical protein [Caudoviricetes sp.]DAT46851.1 MAG TPA: hypothetical protein [Caudoviricetes sp.]DAW64859.1 MAG TPA: hypothetical protein [Caudoviricetes sp.]